METSGFAEGSTRGRIELRLGAGAVPKRLEMRGNRPGKGFWLWRHFL